MLFVLGGTAFGQNQTNDVEPSQVEMNTENEEREIEKATSPNPVDDTNGVIMINGELASPEVPMMVKLVVIGIFFVACLLSLLVVVSMWAVYSKAGKPGYAAIIPIYHHIVFLEIAGEPIWWFFLLLLPLVNVVVFLIVSIDLAKKFGKGTGFGIGLLFLPFIFYPILGFGSAKYNASRSN